MTKKRTPPPASDSVRAIIPTKPPSDTLLWQRLGPITYVPVEKLQFYSRTLRKHPERQVVQLAASISQFGFNVPVLVDETWTIVAGEARVEAARRAGLTEVPTISLAHLTSAQVKAFRIADNKLASLGTFDLEALRVELEEIISIGEISVEALGFVTAEVDVLLTTPLGENAPDPADALPDPPAAPVSRPGDLWRLGQHRLLCGSSIEALSWTRLLDGRLAVMAFTDPPYGCKVNGHVSGLGKVRHEEFAMASGEMSPAEFIRFSESWLAPMADMLADGAILHVCIDWRMLHELITATRTVGLNLINLCVWNKPNGGMGSLYRSKHELVLVLKKGRAPHLNQVELGRHGRYRTNIWEGYPSANSFGASRMADLADHPTVKPTALVSDAIRDVSRHGDIVLDAFIGSGTTILAAERTGRIAYGIEIEPRFVDVAMRRWGDMTGAEAVLDGTGETYADVAVRRAMEADTISHAASRYASIVARPRQRASVPA